MLKRTEFQKRNNNVLLLPKPRN